MKIVVTTPTGRIGRIIVRELLAPEFSVRVIVRDPRRLSDETLEQVEVVRGSSDDLVSLGRALEGAEALYWCVPPPPLEEQDVQGHYERFARAACQAIKAAGTRRVVTISAGGKGLARNAGPITALHAMEDILNECGAVIRHLRCGSFMENFLSQAPSIWERGTISYPIAGHIPVPMVAAADIADVALKWLVRGDWKGCEGIAVHGPEDLTYNQAVAILERVLERPVRYQQASVEEFMRTLEDAGASAEHARSLADMFAELARGITQADSKPHESTTPTTLATWAQRELVPVLDALATQSTQSQHLQVESCEACAV